MRATGGGAHAAIGIIAADTRTDDPSACEAGQTAHHVNDTTASKVDDTNVEKEVVLVAE